MPRQVNSLSSSYVKPLFASVCRKNAQRTIDELRANVADLETRLRNETNRIKSRYETERHEMEMQIDVLSRNNGELTKNNKGLLTKIKVQDRII